VPRRLAVGLFLATLAVPLIVTPAVGGDSFEAHITLESGPPTPVTVDDPASVRAEFPTTFDSIELLCFSITFEGDLLDTGEQVEITFRENVGAFGWVNPSDVPVSTQAACLARGLHDEIIDLFRDGQHAFQVEMFITGSVTIASLSVGATGVATGLAPCTILGTFGSDLIQGTAGTDVICARTGNDTANGRAGADIVRGGKGNDRLYAGNGADRLVGQEGNDRLRSTDGVMGNDTLYGGPGEDVCIVDPRDRVSGCEHVTRLG
jgi:hypothetical protein